jgi:hypothetical protein
MKILYNVTIKIDAQIAEEWLDWMKTRHIPDVMATGKFESYRLLKIIGEEDEYGIGFAIQYIAPDIEHFEQYNKECAPSLQKEHTERYQGRYGAFRTLMEVLE